MDDEQADEIWLNHLRPNEHKWLALVGEYPYRLVAVGDDAVEAVAAAKVAGFDEVTLFKAGPFPFERVPVEVE